MLQTYQIILFALSNEGHSSHLTSASCESCVQSMLVPRPVLDLSSDGLMLEMPAFLQ